MALGTFGGVRVFVVPSWVHEVQGLWITLRPGRCPPKGQRKGTRRQWKRANPRGLRFRRISVAVEPDHFIRGPGAIYCTAAQAAKLRAAIPEGLTTSRARPEGDVLAGKEG